jgi:peptidyl-prolyl cis-trans isomerase C
MTDRTIGRAGLSASSRPADHDHAEALEGVGRYHLLRAASERFQTEPAALSEEQMREARRRARRSLEIEALVLDSAEARQVVIPAQQVEDSVAQLRGRYPDTEAFVADLGRNGLDLETLAAALRRELIFDAVMQRVAARHARVDEVDVRLYYELHRGRFTSPERRTARHILITVNDAFDENHRDAALARIERLAEQLRERPGALGKRFAALARQHSECPTALEEGRLGEVRRGQLYPELDALLFRLEEGQVGGTVETELGFHILWCERIHRQKTLAFQRVRESIRQVLMERRRRDCQKTWLANLRRTAIAEPQTHP